ncbi:DUF6783 domain-containing protein [Blautia glucerasea]
MCLKKVFCKIYRKVGVQIAGMIFQTGFRVCM